MRHLIHSAIKEFLDCHPEAMPNRNYINLLQRESMPRFLTSLIMKMKIPKLIVNVTKLSRAELNTLTLYCLYEMRLRGGYDLRRIAIDAIHTDNAVAIKSHLLKIRKKNYEMP